MRTTLYRYGLPAVLFLLAWGCFQEEEQPFLSLREFESSAYDTVLVLRADSSGPFDTLYRGPVGAGQLDRIPIPAYRGEKIVLVVEGFRDGGLVFRKDLHYDGASGRTDSTFLRLSPHASLHILDPHWPDSLQEGDSLRLPSVEVLPEKLTDKRIGWRSLIDSVAGIKGDSVRLAGPGRALLVAQLEADPSKKDSLFLTVRARPRPVPDSVPVRKDTTGLPKDTVGLPKDSLAVPKDTSKAKDSLEISRGPWTVEASPSEVVLYVGGPDTVVSARVLPAAGPQDIRWRLSPPGLAAWGEGNRLKGVSAGTAVAVAMSEADSLARDTVRVTVKRDVPVLQVGRADTAVGVDALARVAPVVEQEYGGIALFAWDWDGDGKWDDSSGSVPAELTHGYAQAGTYGARFYVRDTEGNEQITAKRIRAMKGPVVVILSPGDGSYTRAARIPVEWSIDGKTQDTLATETLRTQGPNVIIRSATDSAGNHNADTLIVVWDTVPPNPPMMLSPHWQNTRTPSWKWTSGGGGNGMFRYSMDIPIPENSRIVQETAFVSLTELSPGLHTLLVQESDSAGNWSGVAKLQMRIDIQAPGTPRFPNGLAYPTNDPHAAWTWTSGGNGGMGWYRYKLDNNDFSICSLSIADSTFHPDSIRGEGSHILYVQERDSAGNWSDAGAGVRVFDFTPPSKPVFNGKPDSLISSAKPIWTWKGDVSDGAGIYKCRIEEGTVPPETVYQPRFASLQDLPDGRHTLSIQERDSAGNWSEEAYQAMRIDTHPPEAPQVTASFPDTRNGRPLWTWSGRGGGIGTFRYNLDDAQVSLGGTVTQDTFFVPIASLYEGTHVLHVQERDSAGNWSEAGSATIRIHGQTGYLVSYNSLILKTPDAGGTWELQSGGALMSPFFLDSRTFYLLAGYGGVLKSVDAGMTLVSMPSIAGYLYSLYFTDANTGYGVGQDGIVSKTIDGGRTWDQRSTGVGFYLQSVTFTDANTGYAVGQAGTVLKTINAGANWFSPPKAVFNNLRCVKFTSINTGFAVGDMGAIIRTTDAGSSWTQIASGTSTTLNSIHFLDKKHGFIGGFSGTILRTADSGKTWLPVPSGTSNDLFSIAFADDIHGSAVGAGGVLLQTEDAGASWKSVGSGNANRLYAVRFVDSTTGYAFGEPGAILKTTDAGATWTWMRSGVTPYLRTIHFADAERGLAAGNGGTVLRTDNGGQDWSTVATGSASDINAVFLTPSRTGYASGGTGTILKSENGGITWSSLGTGTGADLRALFFHSADSGFAVGTGIVLKTVNGGASWSPTTVPSNLNAVHFPASDVGFAVGDAGAILKTENAGASWIPLSSGTSKTLNSVYFIDANTGYVSGMEGTLLKTTNAGVTWRKLNSGTGNWLFSVRFVNADVGLATGDYGTLLKTENAGETWTPVPCGITGSFFRGIHFP